MSSHRIFVTGGTGVVGRLLVPQLIRLGHTVTALGRNPTRLDALERAGARTLTLDLFDQAELRQAIADHDVVINLATHMPGSLRQMALPRKWRENDRVRRDGSRALVAAAIEAGVTRFIQESFAPIYEDGGDRWIDERWPVKPARYNRSSIDAETSAQRMTDAGGIGVVLRFAGFYGSDGALREMLGIVRKGWSPLPGAPSAYWSSIAHEDAASAVAAALDVPAGVYNVCDDEPLGCRAWADAIADAAGLPRPRLMPRWLVALGGSQTALLARSQRMSNAKLKRATGWAPRWRSAREGLAAAVRALDAGAVEVRREGAPAPTPAARSR